MNVLVIKDDKPGHYNQTEGLILQLKEVYTEVNIEYIEIEIKSKLLRKFLRVLLNNFTSFFQKKKNLHYLSFFYKSFKLPENKPDLVLSTGGNTSNFNVWITKAYNCKNILNGALRGLKEELFTYITTVVDLGYKNQIILDVAPSIITTKKLYDSSQEFINEKKIDTTKTYYSLLIGGNGSGYSYDNEFFDDLINFVKKISLEQNISWLITTSRRTPLENEIKLQKELENHSSYFVAYNLKEEKVLLPFFALSKKIFVTEESASMISEAISSCKPVFTIKPKNINDNRNYQIILEKFKKEKLIFSMNLEKEVDINSIIFNKKVIRNIFIDLEI
jgi:mitochondrial fission protein ELM1